MIRLIISKLIMLFAEEADNIKDTIYVVFILITRD